ncbi:uncharacterized protein N7498_004463 [Penicillium cinerascens]|uniref:Enoyl reductase (ER) domain-containing protein n=1 Tax=Penicillium cinerascens TaxID=70096 RepID=A0A9W9N404_9EURO|nr:uncharacterized protein N7498_004463 [Penicillium cinerascens]KAJ5212817.1 hypothetical protein N7498_004463 [Penicillium cinerascens]
MGKAIFIGLSGDTPGKPGIEGELLVQLRASALNHRDVFIRQRLNAGVTFDVTIGSDGAGIVISVGSRDPALQKWVGQRVILNPGKGWKDAIEGPDSKEGYAVMGGTRHYRKGTFQEYITIHERDVEIAPDHLIDAEAAALPLAGLTAWRALMTKAGMNNCRKGAVVLVTGIGGGVALMVMQFAIVRGADVYVTSSSEEKIQQAVRMGAKGGVNYKKGNWDKMLLAMLSPDRPHFDAVIDGAEGDSIGRSAKSLKAGGVLSLYGMTVSPKMPFPMQAVIKNIDVRGSTMGSRKEFRQMVEFVKAHKIRPVISRILQTGLDDLDAIESLFTDMRNGKQFGKLVLEFGEGFEKSKI